MDAGKRRKEEAAEEEIKEAGKRMLEEAQKRASAAAALANSTSDKSAGPSRPRQSPTSTSTSNANGHSLPQPRITPLDLTLILQFPPTSNPDQVALQHSLSRAYGPISHLFIIDPNLAPVVEGKKKKPRGRKAIVEFAEGNWGGCWSCWHDVEDGKLGDTVGLGEGVKVKWAEGKTPDWVDWASTQKPQRTSAPTPTATLPSFDSAPDFGRSTMSDLLASHNRLRDDGVAKKRKEQEFESMTLLKMRQLERDRLAEQIRREEEEEGVV